MMPLRTTTPMAFALAAMLAFGPPAVAQNGDSHRDQWQRVDDVAAALGAVPGAHIADIGAGAGYFTHRLRNVVGPDGRIYAVDVSRERVARLRGSLDVRGLRNVDVILGRTDDPRLPFGSLDGALIVNAYHEMDAYPAMLAAILEALRPGGALVIVDNPPTDPSESRDDQVRDHDIHIDLAAADLRDAGYEIVREDPEFILDTSDGHDHRMWLLAARRPLQDPPTLRLPGAPAGPAGDFSCPFPASPDALAERLSPPDSAETVVDGGRVKICYSRPGARGRIIMGDLVPFDAPWRTGANEATVIRADRPLLVGDLPVDPGWYSLYTVPGQDEWTVVINRLADRTGIPIDEWVRSHDLGTFTVSVELADEPVERLTARFEPAGSAGAELVLEWEMTRVRVPIRGG